MRGTLVEALELAVVLHCVAADQVERVEVPHRGSARDPEGRILGIFHPFLRVHVVDVKVTVGDGLFVN